MDHSVKSRALKTKVSIIVRIVEVAILENQNTRQRRSCIYCDSREPGYLSTLELWIPQIFRTELLVNVAIMVESAFRNNETARQRQS